MRVLVLLSLLLVAGCSVPSAPTAVPAPKLSYVSYDVNVPTASLAFSLKFQYPEGIQTSPIDAQRRWDYTSTYLGSPNVYYGETSPHCEYPGVGIVVAPRSVAGMSSFTAGDWPGMGYEAGVTYIWLGRFTYTAPAPVGSYYSDPTGAGCPYAR